jgi:hypothetical protein
MWTKWYSPKISEQIASDEILYQGSLTSDGSAVFSTLGAVSGVATSQGGLVQEGARSLVFRDFGIAAQGVAQGVELMLTVDRFSRIQDHNIRLWQNSQIIGRNLADPLAENQWVYGGALSLWRVDTLQVNNEHFGVLIDLSAHKQYPSRDIINIKEVKIRVDFG